MYGLVVRVGGWFCVVRVVSVVCIVYFGLEGIFIEVVLVWMVVVGLVFEIGFDVL